MKDNKKLNWKNRLSMRTETSADGLKLFWCVVIDGNIVESLGDLGKFIEDIESKTKRELLEEIKKMIDKNVKHCKLNYFDSIQELRKNINLLNKK